MNIVKVAEHLLACMEVKKQIEACAAKMDSTLEQLSHPATY